MKILDNLKPTKQPIAYAFVLIVLYQLFVKGDSIPDSWVQYVVEFVASGAAWGLVKPMAKIKDDNNAGGN
jgi:hypothetical protein